MQVKVSETTPIQIDYLVAKCEGAHPQISYPDKRLFGAIGDTFDYSTDWAQGGPIIERERIETRHDGRKSWCAWHRDYGAIHGPTLLIAAMRCFVASKLGDTVEIPDELV